MLWVKYHQEELAHHRAFSWGMGLSASGPVVGGGGEGLLGQEETGELFSGFSSTSRGGEFQVRGWEGEERRRTSAHSQASLETFVLFSFSFFLDTKPLYEPLDSKTQTAEKFSTPAQILLTLFILCILDY